ncbi:MAG: GDP-mannose 4,6-dehydratase, partial [Pseudomonadota bacterium]
MSPYASAKCGADRLVYSYMATYNIPAVIVRPFNIFGPRQHLEKVVPRFITSILRDEPLTIHGAGHAARDFVYVEDICRALDMVLHAPCEDVCGEVFNVATGKHRTINDIAQALMEELHAEDHAELEHVIERPGQVTRHTGCARKINTLLGWAPQVSWREGLRRTIRWYQDHEDVWNKQLWLRKVPLNYTPGITEYH